MANETKGNGAAKGSRYIRIGSPDSEGARDMVVEQVERIGPEGSRTEVRREVTYKGYGEQKGAGSLWLKAMNKLASDPTALDANYTLWLNATDLKARQAAKEGGPAEPEVPYGKDGRKLNLVTGIVTKDGRPDSGVKPLPLDQRIAVINNAVTNAQVLGLTAPKAFATAKADLVKNGSAVEQGGMLVVAKGNGPAKDVPPSRNPGTAR